MTVAEVVADMRAIANAHAQWAMSAEATATEGGISAHFAGQLRRWAALLESASPLNAEAGSLDQPEAVGAHSLSSSSSSLPPREGEQRIARRLSGHGQCYVCGEMQCGRPHLGCTSRYGLNADVQLLLRELSDAQIAGEAREGEAAPAPVIDVRSDVGVYCAHCSHAIAVCPECGKAEWRKGDHAR